MKLSHGMVAAIIGVLALLIGFQYVVQQAMQQGDQRREAQAAEAHARWQCEDLASAKLRMACRAELMAAPGEGAVLNVGGPARR